MGSSAPALDAGITLLEILARGPRSYGELMSAAPVSRATAARLVRVLAARGWVAKRPDGRWELGLVAVRFGIAPAEAALLAAARPLLAPLARDTACSVVLHAWDGRLLTCLDKVMHPAALAMQEVGSAGGDCTSTPWGWLILLAMDGPARRAQRTHRVSVLPGIIRELPRLQAERDATGTLLDDQRVHPGVRRLAAPITDRAGRIIGSIGLGAPGATLAAARLAQARLRLRAAARSASAALA